ncbi:FYVE zinc finger-domain-containing protein [Syncephalastrum racemosum]|uniref:FYVE zinc finger-domain-containing protein n=1 Tax=Syncephalastrum racemosum TaxID=13706 RepID=A0A1X2HCN9_SYNRA|nr:FYVE zinc finger-domain-containing protein [Syncephalastrum racemosum]
MRNLTYPSADTNQYRKHQATLLVTQYSAHVDRLNTRVQSLAQQVSTPISPVQHNPELARMLDFSSHTEEPAPSRPHASTYSNETADFDANPWSRDSAVPNASSQPWSSATLQTPQDNSSLNHVDLLEQDDTASIAASAAAGPRPFTWESDMSAKECRRCERRFGLIVRRHHCRRCGLIVCDKCSASRTYLNASEILQDPNGPVESVQVLASQHQRVCDKCYADLGMRA